MGQSRWTDPRKDGPTWFGGCSGREPREFIGSREMYITRQGVRGCEQFCASQLVSRSQAKRRGAAGSLSVNVRLSVEHVTRQSVASAKKDSFRISFFRPLFFILADLCWLFIRFCSFCNMIFLAWSCFLALSTTLMSAQAFMSDPNPGT